MAAGLVFGISVSLRCIPSLLGNLGMALAPAPLVALLAACACAAPPPLDAACFTLLIGVTNKNDSALEQFILKPIRLKGVPGGGVDINIPIVVRAPRTIVGEAVTVCDYTSFVRPKISTHARYSAVQVWAEVKWPRKTNLIIYIVQYGKVFNKLQR